MKYVLAGACFVRYSGETVTLELLMLLGCIADDFTGAADVAGTLVRSGMRTVQWLGVPKADAPKVEADAAVIALKSRTAPVADAVRASLEALEYLRQSGCKRFFFKYCSTFDSTSEGNIGPVAEALLHKVGGDITVACPAFPRNGRTVYQGHLFVGDRLLSDSGMQHHPLTPMNDSDLVRVLGKQTRGKVALIDHTTVSKGGHAIRERLEHLRRDEFRFVITDAISDEDLMVLGEAAADMRLVTGASGMAMGLAESFRAAGLFQFGAEATKLQQVNGPVVVLAGSCSAATRRQVAHFAARHPSYRLDPRESVERDAPIARAVAWAVERMKTQPVLIYATASPDDVRAAQDQLGRHEAGSLVEHWLASIAKQLAAQGVRRFVVAGGETSGAVLGALNVAGLRIGGEIDPGVPRTVTLGGDPFALVLKSGNFGSDDLFLKAAENQA